ncbi:hypothetical protein [Aureimonas altamirensis]
MALDFLTRSPSSHFALAKFGRPDMADDPVAAQGAPENQAEK